MKTVIRNSLIIFLCSIFLQACSSQGLGKYPSLVNQGILPLSTTNPYVGANMFLAREVEKSPTLFRFFKMRGAPMATEIIHQQLGLSRPRLLMFYPASKEVFVAELESDKPRYDWIVRGPFMIERRDYRQLSGMQLAHNGEPAFQIWGKPYRFKFHRPVARIAKRVEPELPPPPKPRKRRVIKAKVEKSKTKTLGIPNDLRDFRPINSDQLAIYMSKGYAERASNGDVIHTVGSNGEGFADIARWYTKTDSVAHKIAEINGKMSTSPLLEGQRIRVPLSMVKEFKSMPGGAIARNSPFSETLKPVVPTVKDVHSKTPDVVSNLAGNPSSSADDSHMLTQKEHDSHEHSGSDTEHH